MAKAPHIKVLVVRAAPNEWDSTGRLSGSADLPPTAEGRQGAERFAAGLVDGSLGRVCTGPEESAVATGASVAGAVGAQRAKVLPRLHELGLGRWEGMASAEAEARYSSAYRQWREDPTVVEPPGGETIAAAAERLIPVVREVLSRCRADESCGVCFVLRPMAFGIVRCWLRGQELSGLWSAAESEEGHEWFLVDRSSLRRDGDIVPGVVRDAG